MNPFRKYFYQIVLTLGVCLLSVGAQAQGDTTGIELNTDSTIKYLKPLEYAFMMNEQTRFMLRLPLVGVGAEVEVLPYFTLMGQFYMQPPDNGKSSFFNLDAEMRWYYGSKKKGVRNMSGNYIALGYKNRFFNLSSKILRTHFYYARWGIQRRFLGNGLIDLGINAGFSKSIINFDNLQDNGIFIQSTGAVGLGLVFNQKAALDYERLCPVLKCFEKETFLLKLNTANLFSLYHSQSLVSDFFRINPQVTLEQKLFNAPFSIGVDLFLNYNWKKQRYYSGQNEGEAGSFNYGYLTARANLRYYYNLKRRIRKGKSGNGLSANYVAGGVLRQYSSLFDSQRNDVFNAILLTTGVQRTFGDHFYFDVEFGGAFDLENKNPSFYGNAGVGIKF